MSRNTFNFSTLLNSQWILHQSIFPYTLQQNGITERKNKHLVETGRTMLFGVNVIDHH